MKKVVLFFTFVSVLVGFSSLTAQTISLLSVSSASVCPGNTFDVTFNATGTYNSGNAFEVRLSDPTGSFATFTYLGSTTNSSGVINCLLPANTAAGTTYALEVVSNSPQVSSNLVNNFKVNTLPSSLYISSSNPTNSVLLGQSVSFVANVTNAPTINWDFGVSSSNQNQVSTVTSGTTTATVSYSTVGTQTVTVAATSADGCTTTSATRTIQVLDCSPVIPANTNIISTTTLVSSYLPSPNYWVCGGNTLSFNSWNSNLYNGILFVENGGTLDLSAYSSNSPLTIYLKAGAVVILPPYIGDQYAITVVKEIGASVVNLAGSYAGYYYQPATVLTCTSGLTFDHSNFPCGTICYSPAVSASVVLSSTSTQLCSTTSGVVLTATPNFNASSYEWYQVGNNTVLQTGTSNTFTVSATGDYYVKAIIVNSVGTCVSPSSNTVSITSGSTSGVVTISASGSTTLCNGGNVTLATNLSGSFSYAWFRNGVAISGATTNSLAIGSTGFINLAGNYYLQVSNANGCVWVSNTIAVNTGAAPVVTITGPSTSCGTAITLIASGATTYSWIGGPATSNYTINPSGTLTYSVIGTNVQGCSDTATKTVTSYPICTTSTVGCGITYTKMNTSYSAANVVGAISYRFTFYNPSDLVNPVTSITQASRTLTFSNVSGLFYNKTYVWTVAVDKGTGFGPESSKSCTITFAPAKTTVPCGLSYAKLNNYTAAGSVFGALNYRFKFYDQTNPTIVAATITQASYYIYFNQVPGLMYDKTYFWTVEVEYATETGTTWGPASSNTCTITFAPAKTTVPCGLSYTKLNNYTAAGSVYGALNYRFKFYDQTNPTIVAATITQASYYIYFNQVPGLMYDKTYFWTVEVEYATETGTAWGPASNNTCTITFAPAKTTVPCGLSYTKLNNYTAAGSVYGALNYRFSFYDQANPLVVAATITQPSYYIYFNQVPGLMYNTTYNWTVEVEYATATGSAWGPASSNACTITFAEPKTTVPCGSTYATLNTYTACGAVYAATRYQFSFYDVNTNVLVAQKTQFSNYIYFNTVSGLQNNTNYKWTVTVEYATYSGNVWSTPSNPCLITFGSPSARIAVIESTDEIEAIQEIGPAELFVNAFPNPTAGKVKISSNQLIKSIEVLSVSGQLLFVSDSVEEVDLHEFEAGMYIFRINTENGLQHIRIVKEL